jgi:hypothetical protein
MRDRRGEPRLATETFVVDRRALGLLERLDRDFCLGRLVASDPDITHSTATDALDEPDLPS